jgi:phage terminase small subunit
MRPLTDRQSLFVREYLVDLNATKAAERAGYSPRSASRQAVDLLRKPQVAAAVQHEMDKRGRRTAITADKVLAEIAKLGFSDVRGMFDEQGRLRAIKDLPDDLAAAIASFEVVSQRVPGSDPVEIEHVAKVKLWDKRGSLELLGKHLKLFTERIEVEATSRVYVLPPEPQRGAGDA